MGRNPARMDFEAGGLGRLMESGRRAAGSCIQVAKREKGRGVWGETRLGGLGEAEALGDSTLLFRSFFALFFVLFFACFF